MSDPDKKDKAKEESPFANQAVKSTFFTRREGRVRCVNVKYKAAPGRGADD